MVLCPKIRIELDRFRAVFQSVRARRGLKRLVIDCTESNGAGRQTLILRAEVLGEVISAITRLFLLQAEALAPLSLWKSGVPPS